MSRQNTLRHHLRRLDEIKEIMNAMKNMAYLETRKLAGRLTNLQQMREELEQLATDFLCHHPYPTEFTQAGPQIRLLFGSERGFCGDFNERLLASLPPEANGDAQLLAVGRKLGSRLDQVQPGGINTLRGAEVAEEVTPLLEQLLAALTDLQPAPGGLRLFAFYHDASSNQPVNRALLPPFLPLQPPPRVMAPGPGTCPPLLGLSPDGFFYQLVDHYLFVALHDIAYQSLMAENSARIQHMTGAIRRLDEHAEELTRQYHRARQEEITEEIEVILLNSSAWME